MLTSVLLVSCAPVGRGMQQIGTAMHKESTEIDRRIRDMFDAQGIEGDPLPRKLEPTYCYKTIGEVVCYREPLPGMNNKLVGKQVPEPAFDEYSYPYPETKPAPPPPEEPSITPVPAQQPVMRDRVITPVEPVVVQDVPPPTGQVIEQAVPVEQYVNEPTVVAPAVTESGDFVYEVPESAIRPREDIPAYKKPRELIPGELQPGQR